MLASVAATAAVGAHQADPGITKTSVHIGGTFPLTDTIGLAMVVGPNAVLAQAGSYVPAARCAAEEAFPAKAIGVGRPADRADPGGADTDPPDDGLLLCHFCSSLRRNRQRFTKAAAAPRPAAAVVLRKSLREKSCIPVSF